MLAASAVRLSAEDPLSALEVGEVDEVDDATPPDWTTVTVRAASLNHHDLWSLRGIGLSAERLPMILGCDAAGVDEDGNEVVVHSVISSDVWLGDETLDPKRSLLSERYPGTFAERVRVPAANLLPKPAELSFEEASCLPTSWLTAYRMLFTESGLRPGETVLIQGAGGGMATALTVLAKAAGYRVWVTGRTEAKRERSVAELGADAAFEPGARLPERVDAVMETVGAATWAHSLKSLRPGGTVVCCGATSGPNPPADLNRVFFLKLRVQGTTMGTREELAGLLKLCAQSGIRPVIDRTLPLTQAKDGFAAMESGDLFGKVVFTL